MRWIRNSFVAASLCVAASASADDAVRHTVKKGDTCASIAQQYYGDSRLVDVLHKANPAIGSLPAPHHLKEGTVLIVPPKPAGESAPDARLTTVRNRVEVLAPETRPGKPKDPLFRGNRVSTEASSSADVTFRDESQVKLGERTLVVILGDVRSAAKKEEAATVNAAELVTGNLRAFMSGKSKDEIAVQTSAANVAVTAGEAQVGSDEKKTSRLAVYQGKSSISAQGVKREVVPGFGSKAEMGKPPTVPKPLPPAPRWTKLPLRVLLDRGAGAPSIIGEYDLPASASAAAPLSEWRVQVGRDERFRDLVLDAKVPVATKRFEGKTPGPGHYWLRVSAIDDDHFEGPFGPAALVLVVHPKVTAEDATHRRVELDPPDAACMRVGNTRLTWVKAPIIAGTQEPVRLRCSSEETAPTTLLDIDRLDDFPTP